MPRPGADRIGAAYLAAAPGARPSYDLEIVHHGPDNGPGGRTGVLFLTAVSATSATGFLRRLTEESRPLQRLFLVTDARVKLPLGTAARNSSNGYRKTGASF